ncbi:hypothetical protein F4778DRAFT_82318 [Xylariomycetidae sp. FL2044]|nr:hypothetical protein F4778DRAFT_82318 [Xylariomycetidae sp. FL2044]
MYARGFMRVLKEGPGSLGLLCCLVVSFRAGGTQGRETERPQTGHSCGFLGRLLRASAAEMQPVLYPLLSIWMYI